MADFTPNPQWHPTINLVERDEVIYGGKDGNANLAAQQLADRTEYLHSKVATCDSIEELRNTPPTLHGQRITLMAYHLGGHSGKAEYIADLSDTTTLDDGATCIVTADGRWKRLHTLNTSVVPELSAINRAFSLHKIGTGENNLSQSFVIDDINRFIFTHHESGGKAYVVRYNLDYNPFNKVAIDTMQGGEYIGHQGLGVEHKNEQAYIWASAGDSITNAGRSVIRFQYKPNGTLEQSDIEAFVLFGDEFKNSNTTPCISQDQKYLIARGRLAATNQTVLRVFKLQDTHNHNDLTNKYVTQFGIDPITFTSDDFPVQGIACDGQVIVVQLGHYNVAVDKMLLVYSMTGELLYRNNNSTIGKDDALAEDSGQRWEPEGLCFARNGQGVVTLYHHIMSGDPGDRTEYVYSNVRANAQFQSFDNKPALFLRGIRDIAVPEGQKVTFAQAKNSNTDEYHDFIDLYPTGFDFYNDTGENTLSIGISQSTNKDRVMIRGKQTLANGAGINLYNQGDISAGMIKLFTGGVNSQTLSLNGVNKTIHWGLDGEGSIGSASNRVGEIFAANGTINTSDRRAKTNIKNITDKVIKAWRNVEFKLYKWKEAKEAKGDKARLHTGVIAQQIKKAFDEQGIDALAYGLLCYDEWDSQDAVVEEVEVTNADGSISTVEQVVTPAIPAGNKWGIRAEECLFLEAESQRRLIAELTSRIEKIEKQST